MASPARLRSVWAAGRAPCLGSLLAALPSPVRSLAGIPGEAELPTVVGIWARLEAQLHGQAGLLSRAALRDRAVQLAGLCAQQLGSAVDSGSKAASGHWAPLQMGMEVMLCSWAGLLAAGLALPAQGCRMGSTAARAPPGQARLSGRAGSHVRQLSGRGCRMGSATGTARWLCTQTGQNCQPGSVARQGRGLGFTDGQSHVWDRRSGIALAGTPPRSADSPLGALLLFSISD